MVDNYSDYYFTTGRDHDSCNHCGNYIERGAEALMYNYSEDIMCLKCADKHILQKSQDAEKTLAFFNSLALQIEKKIEENK